MKTQPLKTFAIILAVLFVILNILYFIWPTWLILEDIRNGTVEGTGIEMMVLLPYFLEILSIPVIIGEIVYIVFSIKSKYVFQIALFNILLFQ